MIRGVGTRVCASFNGPFDLALLQRRVFGAKRHHDTLRYLCRPRFPGPD